MQVGGNKWLLKQNNNNETDWRKESRKGYTTTSHRGWVGKQSDGILLGEMTFGWKMKNEKCVRHHIQLFSSFHLECSVRRCRCLHGKFFANRWPMKSCATSRSAFVRFTESWHHTFWTGSCQRFVPSVFIWTLFTSFYHIELAAAESFVDSLATFL